MMLPLLFALGSAATATAKIFHNSTTFQCHTPLIPSISRGILTNSSDFDSARQHANEYFESLTNPVGGMVDSVYVSVFGADGESMYSQGFGYVNQRRNTTPTDATIYRIGSISKAFTAMQLIKMREEGLVDFEKDIKSYIPDFKYPNTTWKERFNISSKSSTKAPPTKITTSQLLSHLGGFTDNMHSDNEAGPTMLDIALNRTVVNAPTAPGNLADLLGNVSTIPLMNRPGTYPQYSNMGAALAGLVAVGANPGRNLSFSQLLQRDIFTPLGMNSSAWEYSPTFGHQMALPRESGDEYASLNSLDPAGSMFASSADLRRWLRWILKAHDFYDTYDSRSGPLKITSQAIRQWLLPVFGFRDNFSSAGGDWENYAVSISPNDTFAGTRRVWLNTKGGNLDSYAAIIMVDLERGWGATVTTTRGVDQYNYLSSVSEIVEQFVPVIDRLRNQEMARQFAGTYYGQQNATDIFSVEVHDDSLYLVQWIVDGVDVLASAGQPDARGHNWIPLWPSAEPGVFRVLASPYCFVNTANSLKWPEGVPDELVIFEDGIVYKRADGKSFKKK